MNKDNLMKVDIQIINNTPSPRPTPTPTPIPTPLPMPTPIPMPAPSPSESIDPDYEEGVLLTEEDRYNYELDMSELIAEEKRSEEYHGVKFCE